MAASNTLTLGTITPNKVAIYIRWSTDDQSDGTTLQVQLERCKAFLTSQGYDFREDLLFIDDGYSGGNLDRPGITKLRELVASGEVECVVVYKLDRLSRSVIDTVDLVTREWEGRCFLRSTSEDINTSTPQGRLIFTILISYAEFERGLIRERTMSGRQKRFEEGSNPGIKRPFGYAVGPTPGTTVIVEHEASVVRRIFEMYLNGLGFGAITFALNEESAPRPGAAPWNQVYVQNIISNVAYVGTMAWGMKRRTTKAERTRTGCLSTVPQPVENHQFKEDAYPAIIDQDTFDKAQVLRASRRSAAGGDRKLTKADYSDHLLTGVASCKCGGHLVGVKATPPKNNYPWYQCGTRKRMGPTECDSLAIRQDRVHEVIEGRLKALLTDGTRQRLLAGLETRLEARRSELAAALSSTQSTLTELRSRLKKLEADYDAGELPARLFTARYEKSEAELATALAESAALEGKAADLTNDDLERHQLAQRLERIRAWDLLTTQDRKDLLRGLTNKIVIYRDPATNEATLEIEWAI